MTDFEFGDEELDFSARQIPRIPGVEHSEIDEDERAILSEEPDEESEEDVIEEIVQEIREMLTSFGVEAISGVEDDELVQLWHRMDMSQHLIGDLALLTTTRKRKVLQNAFAVPDIHDLIKQSEILDHATVVRKDLIEEVAPNLMKLGYGRLNAYRLPRHSNENIAQAHRVEGWLLGLPLLESVPSQVRTQIVASKTKKIGPSQVFRITREEIVRQAKIIDGPEYRRQYDQRVGYEATAYKATRKSIINAFKIAEYALSRFIKP